MNEKQVEQECRKVKHTYPRARQKWLERTIKTQKDAYLYPMQMASKSHSNGSVTMAAKVTLTTDQEGFRCSACGQSVPEACKCGADPEEYFARIDEENHNALKCGQELFWRLRARLPSAELRYKAFTLYWDKDQMVDFCAKHISPQDLAEAIDIP